MEGTFHDAHKVYYNPLGKEETRVWIATFATRKLAVSYLVDTFHDAFTASDYEVRPV